MKNFHLFKIRRVICRSLTPADTAGVRLLQWKERCGFTVLYAVLVSSLLLAIGASIYNISLKDIILTGSAGDSQRAIYAADAAVECAFYWDFFEVNGVQASAFLPPPTTTDITCAGVLHTITNDADTDGSSCQF